MSKVENSREEEEEKKKKKKKRERERERKGFRLDVYVLENYSLVPSRHHVFLKRILLYILKPLFNA